MDEYIYSEERLTLIHYWKNMFLNNIPDEIKDVVPKKRKWAFIELLIL